VRIVVLLILSVSLSAQTDEPKIAGVVPNQLTAGRAADLVISGSGFTNQATAVVDGKPHPVQVNSDKQITLHLDADAVGSAHTLTIVIQQPDPQGGSVESAPANLQVIMDTSHPVINSTNPTTFTPGAGDQQISLTGTGFSAANKVLANGTEVATTVNGPTSLTATIPASMLTAAGSINVAVATPTASGGRRISPPVTIPIATALANINGTAIAPIDPSIAVPSSLKLQGHLTISTEGIKTRGNCGSNKSATQEGKIWGVQVNDDLTFPGTTGVAKVPGMNYPLYRVDNNTYLLPRYDIKGSTIKINTSGQNFEGQIRTNKLGLPIIDFSNLDFAQAGQLLHALQQADAQSQVKQQVANATIKVSIIKISVPAAANPGVDAGTIGDKLAQIIARPDDPADAIQQLLTGGVLTLPASPGRPAIRLAVSSAISQSEVLEQTALAFDGSNLEAEMNDLEHFESSYQNGAGLTLIVDEPCLQFTAAPVFGNQTLTPAITFRYRYDYFDSNIRNYLKFRAEGQTAQSTVNYFQRAQAQLDLGRNLNFKIGQKSANTSPLFLSTSLTGVFSLGSAQTPATPPGPTPAPANTNLPYDWRFGGKFQVLLPFMKGLNFLPGSQSRPMISIDASGAGSRINNVTTGPDFQVTSLFAYSATMQPRFTVDINGNAAWSNTARFAGHSSAGYIRLQSRFNLTSDYDFLVRYECGRQSPDYRKSCAWQSGFAFVTR
jgi:hypothetical protein